MKETKNKTTLDLTKVITETYKYGFQSDIEKEYFPAGITEEIIQLISSKKNEPSFLLNFRLKAF